MSNLRIENFDDSRHKRQPNEEKINRKCKRKNDFMISYEFHEGWPNKFPASTLDQRKCSD